MVELVRFVLSNLVDAPDNLDIKQIDGETTTILEIAVAKDDLGRVIGKQGKVINALRDLVRSSLNKNDKKVVIEVLS
ncbi:MAG: KH domain-containing protein [bacterium]|nr:KH domain-containing protein [bacterium]